MSDTIIVAMLSFAGTCIGSLAGISLIKYRIDQLEKKVEKHNNVMERTFKLEEDVMYLKEDINVLPDTWIRRYFHPVGTEEYEINEQIKKQVVFREFNNIFLDSEIK